MEKIPEFGIVGNAPEEGKKGILEGIQEKFLKQEDLLSEEQIKQIKENESIKTPEQLSIIDFANKEIDRLMIEAGVEPFDVPVKNIHILKGEFLKKVGEKDSGAFNQTRQTIVISDSFNNDLLEFSLIIFHEMLHMKSKQVWEVSHNKEKKELKSSPYRGGVKVYSSHKKDEENLEHMHFGGLNEAIVANQEKRTFKKLLDLPENKEHRTDYYSDSQQKTRREIAKEHNISEDDIHKVEGKKFSVFGYENERRTLDYVCQEITKQYPEQYTDAEAVFKVFLNAEFTGHLIEIAHLVEGTFGKGSFRTLGMMDAKNDDLAQSVFEALQKNRRLVIAGKR